MNKKISSNKFTVDLTDENKAILEDINLNTMLPYGQIINRIINVFCGTPNYIKEELVSFVMKKVELLEKQMKFAGPYEYETLMEKYDIYNELVTFINRGKKIEKINSQVKMTQYEINEGVVICPSDWIVVNPEKQHNSCYAGVVECRKSCFEVPHFLFFTNKLGNEYDDELYDEVNKKCCKKWPQFNDILKKQVEIMYDTEGNIINNDEWLKAPILGYFALLDKDDPTLSKDHIFPMGAMIIRKKQ